MAETEFPANRTDRPIPDEAPPPHPERPNPDYLWAFRTALFLFAMCAGTLFWTVIVQPVTDSGGAGGVWERLLRALARQSPSIMLLIAVWCAATPLRWLVRGPEVWSANAHSIGRAGVFVAMAGVLHVIVAPTLLASIEAGDLALRAAPDAPGLGLLALGVILRLAAGTLRDS